MKLDRNINPDGRGKYALIKLREAPDFHPIPKECTCAAVPTSAVDFGDTPDSEFFVIRLKDKYAHRALSAYADAAWEDDPEYSEEIRLLAAIAFSHKNKKRPD